MLDVECWTLNVLSDSTEIGAPLHPMISFSLFNVRAVWTAALLLPLTTAWVAAAERTSEQAFQEYLSEAQRGNVESMSNLGLAYWTNSIRRSRRRPLLRLRRPYSPRPLLRRR